MKKNIIAIILALVMCFTFTACNYKLLDTNWQFNYAYLTMPNGDIIEVKIDSWSEDSTSITIKSEDGNIYCVSMMNCMMTKNQWEEYR